MPTQPEATRQASATGKKQRPRLHLRGPVRMISQSGGLKPRAVAGRPSVTRLTHNSCTGLSTSGMPARPHATSCVPCPAQAACLCCCIWLALFNAEHGVREAELKVPCMLCSLGSGRGQAKHNKCNKQRGPHPAGRQRRWPQPPLCWRTPCSG